MAAERRTWSMRLSSCGVGSGGICLYAGSGPPVSSKAGVTKSDSAAGTGGPDAVTETTEYVSGAANAPPPGCAGDRHSCGTSPTPGYSDAGVD